MEAIACLYKTAYLANLKSKSRCLKLRHHFACAECVTCLCLSRIFVKLFSESFKVLSCINSVKNRLSKRTLCLNINSFFTLRLCAYKDVLNRCLIGLAVIIENALILWIVICRICIYIILNLLECHNLFIHLCILLNACNTHCSCTECKSVLAVA